MPANRPSSCAGVVSPTPIRGAHAETRRGEVVDDARGRLSASAIAPVVSSSVLDLPSSASLRLRVSPPVHPGGPRTEGAHLPPTPPRDRGSGLAHVGLVVLGLPHLS